MRRRARTDGDAFCTSPRPVGQAGVGEDEGATSAAPGDWMAARFTIRAVMRGRQVYTEVAFFGQFTADDRLHRAHQVTREVT